MLCLVHAKGKSELDAESCIVFALFVGGCQVLVHCVYL